MKVAVESIGSYQRKLSVTFPASQVKSELDNEFRKIAKGRPMAGFRKGKVPRQVLEGRFGQQVRGIVADALINRGLRQAVASESLEPVGQPVLDEAGEVSASKDFEFTITLEVRPDVELTRITGIDVVYPKAEVSDEEVDQLVARQLEGKAQLVEVERAAEKGDKVMIEVEAKDGDEVVHSAPGTMIRTAHDPYYAGLEDFVVGLSAGDTKDGEVSFTDACSTEELKGRTLAVSVKVHSVQADQAPELTDELAEELGFEGGIDGMREALRARALAPREEMARNQARANVLEALIAENPFEVPEGLIDDSLQMLIDQLRQQQRQMGRDPRSLSFTDAQMADLRLRAAFAAKAGLILEKVSKDEDLAITDEELEARYQSVADGSGMTVEAVRGFYTSSPAQISQLKDLMLEEKTIDWLLERANPVDAPEAPAADEPAAEEPAAEEASASDDVDLSFLSGAVGAVKDALATGDYDAHLQAILEAEQNGKARKGALSAIEKRIADIG